MGLSVEKSRNPASVVQMFRTSGVFHDQKATFFLIGTTEIRLLYNVVQKGTMINYVALYDSA
eukprot:scaffold1157_cov122-Cylindrotheca_fusiformis.AAC.4